MMGLTISNDKIKIPGKVLGFLVGAAGLGFGYWAHAEKATVLETETRQKKSEMETLRDTERNLQDLYDNRQKYESETLELNANAEKILMTFPTFMYLEDKELYSAYLVSSGTNPDTGEVYPDEGPLVQFGITSAPGYGESKFIMSTSYSETSLMELYSVSCMGEFTENTYQQIKAFINYGKRPVDDILNEEANAEQGNIVNLGEDNVPYKYPDRFVLGSIKMSMDPTTGKISGEYTYSTYFITGQKTPYTFNTKVLEYIGPERRINDLFGELTNTLGGDTGVDDTFDTNGFFDSTDITDILDEVDDSLDG